MLLIHPQKHVFAVLCRWLAALCLLSACAGAPGSGDSGGVGPGLNPSTGLNPPATNANSATPGLETGPPGPVADPQEIKVMATSTSGKCYNNAAMIQALTGKDLEDCLIEFEITGRVFLNMAAELPCCSGRFLRLIDRHTNTFIDTESKLLKGIEGSFSITFFSTLPVDVDLYFVTDETFEPGSLDSVVSCGDPACHGEDWQKISVPFDMDISRHELIPIISN